MMNVELETAGSARLEHGEVHGRLRPQIIQASRRISSGGGINGVAYDLERAFVAAGRTCSRFVHTDSEPKRDASLIGEKLELFAEVVDYTICGTRKLRALAAAQPQSIVLTHCDVMYGDIYVNHGLHKAMLQSSPSPARVFLRNPIHPFSYVREELRHRRRVHRRIICLSEHDKAQLIEAYEYVYRQFADSIRVIPNGVDSERFVYSPAERMRVRQDCGFSEEDFVLFFAAWRFEKKGLKHLLRAVGMLPKRVKLMVAGGNFTLVKQYEKFCRELGIADRVVFLGARDDMPALHSASDAYAMPTEFESWGLVGLEAMACGRPALLPPVGGIPDYLQDGRNGLFIGYDPEGIASKLEELLFAPDRVAAMSLCARETARRFSWKNCAQMYLQLIDEVWDEKRGGA